MLHLTDPTYLRYIVDGLESQSIQQENKAALPQGLMGMYEESLPAEQNIRQREKFLQFFSVWALLKKEVSASFVADLLNWPEQEVIDAVATHTKWFNSPASGTYILYHERLRAYLLSKITSNQLKQTNQRIIESCQLALELKKGDEWEIYALEHLASHLLIPAIQVEEQGASFRKLVYDTFYWNRQVEISKGYDWSKKMLNLSLVWAAKQSTEELIECALNKIDLHYMEQNDAPRIVELVAQNDLETALQRIESFGGNDEEGPKRKFILYMLCLMELTLLDSKDKPFRKTAIEKILNHLDESVPVDHSMLNWNYFFPSYLMFQMSCEWAEMGLDYLMVYKRTDEWESDWIPEMGPYSGLQFEVLLECARVISDNMSKSDTLASISSELLKQGKLEAGTSVIQEALECARCINDERLKSNVLIAIFGELAKQGKLEEAALVLQEALECARGFHEEEKSGALVAIATRLVRLGKLEEGASVLQEALECARGINIERLKSDVLSAISTELAKLGKLEEGALIMQEALACAREINDQWEKSLAIRVICTELAKQGNFEEALECARVINVKWIKSEALRVISGELAKQGNFEEAHECAVGIHDEREKNGALTAIIPELAKQGKFEKALECARGINIDRRKSEVLLAIFGELVKQGKLEEGASLMQEALECARGTHNEGKSGALVAISTELAKRGNFDAAFECASGILPDEFEKIEVLVAIYTELAKRGNFDEAFECARGIPDEWAKSKVLVAISTELAKRGNFDAALDYVRGINDELEKSQVLIAISKELAKQGKSEASALVLQDALECARGIRLIISISTELSKQDKLEEAASLLQKSLEFVRGIPDEWEKSLLFVAISRELVTQGKLEEGASVIQESLECASGISDDLIKSRALGSISPELAKQGKLKEALECVREINDEWEKSRALSSISTELSKQGKLEEALECARGISDGLEKSDALVVVAISMGLAKQGMLEKGATVMQEALEFARGINDESISSRAPSQISMELAEQGRYNLAEQTGFEIKLILDRHYCWKDISKRQKDQLGLLEAFKNKNKFQSEEAQSYYLKGWAESITVDDITDELAYLAIQALQHDSTSLEHFLQVYAQHELFFSNPSQEKIDRLNKTLNLQWALDIIAQFPEE